MAKRRPTTPDISPAIARMRQIASQSGDALLLADGPVQADHRLLDLCAVALHHLTASERAKAARDPDVYSRQPTAAERSRDKALIDQSWEHRRLARSAMFKAKRMRATTAAGIYAKALCVRASATGAAEFARTLADDLIACEGLRASLWPAEAAAGGEAVA